jgi:hypothetical protein
MNANELMLWMSARCEGSWSQFRSAVEEFHVETEEAGGDGDDSNDVTGSDLPIYQAIRLGLQRLAHVEFFSSKTERDWRVVPSALAVIQKDGKWVGIFCGARSPVLHAKLNQLGSSVSWDSQGIPGMPDRIRIIAEELRELYQTANQMGLAVQMEAPNCLLAAIPPVDDPRSRFPSEPPAGPGWIIERFSSSQLRWEESDFSYANRATTGLFRFRMRHQRFHYLRWRGKTYGVQVQVGKYVLLRHRRVRNLISYNYKESVFSFPTICRPPLLIERALVLCSGLLPRLERSSSLLEYTQVPENVARLAAGLLGQEIQII